MNGEPRLVAYADGSCIGNPGPGGWGVVMAGENSQRLEFSGGEPSTTNNRMEITAAIEALRRLPEGTPVVIRSDSQYLVKTMTLGWKRRENLDLWRILDTETAKRKVQWEWVRGHSGDPLNERADELARSAAMASGRGSSAPVRAGQLAHPVPRDEPSPMESGSGESEEQRQAEVLRLLRPLLVEDERVRRCASCGRAFVASGDAPQFAYCPLAECQLKRRRDPA